MTHEQDAASSFFDFLLMHPSGLAITQLVKTLVRLSIVAINMVDWSKKLLRNYWAVAKCLPFIHPLQIVFDVWKTCSKSTEPLIKREGEPCK